MAPLARDFQRHKLRCLAVQTFKLRRVWSRRQKYFRFRAGAEETPWKTRRSVPINPSGFFMPPTRIRLNRSLSHGSLPRYFEPSAETMFKCDQQRPFSTSPDEFVYSNLELMHPLWKRRRLTETAMLMSNTADPEDIMIRGFYKSIFPGPLFVPPSRADAPAPQNPAPVSADVATTQIPAQTARKQPRSALQYVTGATPSAGARVSVPTSASLGSIPNRTRPSILLPYEPRRGRSVSDNTIRTTTTKHQSQASPVFTIDSTAQTASKVAKRSDNVLRDILIINRLYEGYGSVSEAIRACKKGIKEAAIVLSVIAGADTTFNYQMKDPKICEENIIAAKEKWKIDVCDTIIECCLKGCFSRLRELSKCFL